VAQNGSTVALKRDTQRKPRKDDAEARYKAEIEQLRTVVMEMTAENLELKEGSEARRSVSGSDGDEAPWHTAQRLLRVEGTGELGGTVT
jgi:hypothetical protein